MRRLTTLGLAALLAACGNGTGPARLSGAYDLVLIGGRSLPTTFDGTGGAFARCYADGEVSFGFEGPQGVLYTRTIWRSGCGSPISAFFEGFVGTYRTKGDSVYLNVASLSEIPGRLSGDRQRLTLRVVDTGENNALVAQTFEFVLR